MKTYTNHIYGDHMSLPKSASNYATVLCQNSGDSEGDNNGVAGEDGEDDDTYGGNEDHLPPEFRSIAACWILKLKESCKLTQSTMDEIVQRVTDLNQYILSRVSMAVKAAITSAGMEVTQELQSIFDPNGNFGRPFKGLETSYQQLQYCRKNLGLVVR